MSLPSFLVGPFFQYWKGNKDKATYIELIAILCSSSAFDMVDKVFWVSMQEGKYLF